MAVVVDVRAGRDTATQSDEMDRITSSGADYALLRLPTGASGSIPEARRLAALLRKSGLMVAVQIGDSEVRELTLSSANAESPFDQVLIPWSDTSWSYDELVSMTNRVGVGLYISAADLIRLFRERAAGDRSGATLPSLLPVGASLVVEPATTVEVGTVLSLLQSAPLAVAKPQVCLELSRLTEFEQISSLAFMSNARVLAGFTIEWVAVTAFELASDALGFFDAVIDLTGDEVAE